jgi:protein involved in polysaccharide export with SLBB domain
MWVRTSLLLLISGLFLSINPSIAEQTQADLMLASTASSSLPSLDGEALYQRYIGPKYRLGPNDVISITVPGTPTFNQRNILIAPDGQITIAPFGTFTPAGLTVDEVQTQLTRQMAQYLNNPQVQVQLEHPKPCRTNITGEVLHPGTYELITDAFRNTLASLNDTGVWIERKSPLLSNILVAAGGLKETADLSHIQIMNRFDNTRIEVDLLDLLENGNAEQDVLLMPGDIVHVPALPSQGSMSESDYKTVSRSTAFRNTIPVKVLGYVNRPGVVWLPSSQSANINSAIAKAGGFFNGAPYPTTRVYIRRPDPQGKLHTTWLDPRKSDVMLRPNDIVYVTDKLIPKVGRAFDYFGRLVKPLAMAANGFNSVFSTTIPTSNKPSPGNCHTIHCEEDDSTGPRYVGPMY